MKYWSSEEAAFRCQWLSVRLEQIAQTFGQMAALSQDELQADAMLVFLRLTEGHSWNSARSI
ncbi:hypothetical protein IQ250_19845 [Pseudanabaenaceae cyanobacterium LEGE 13415]|nr:hypothetical protein [Pseudanabaenaceae cyanobacterium LEGE 13415]